MGCFECLGISGVLKEVRTRTLQKKNIETIPLKINRSLRCNTEVDIGGTGHEGMDWIRLANYIDQYLMLFNRLVHVWVTQFSGIEDQMSPSKTIMLDQVIILQN